MDSYKVLVTPIDRIVEFVPTSTMTLSERLNAIVRFAIYFSFLTFVYFRSFRVFYIPIFISLLTYYLWINREQEGGGVTDGAGESDIDNGVDGCQEPTKENPFMNVLITDYTDNATRPPACDILNPVVADKVDEHFKNGLYIDVDDIWGNKNSQRQFITNPSTTIPNDRDSFMKWCYNTPYVCKDGDLGACTRTELGVNHVHGQIT